VSIGRGRRDDLRSAYARICRAAGRGSSASHAGANALDVQDVDRICDAAKQLAAAAQRRWVSPMDIKTASRSIAHAKVHCIDDAPNEPVIDHVLDNTEVP
jgi:histone H3/H4